MDKIHIQIKSGIGLPKSDNPEILSVIVTRQDICCLAQFMKWAVMQEILQLLHIIAQFMNWALRVSCCCPLHELGNSAAQLMNWAISQIGRNIDTKKTWVGVTVCYASRDSHSPNLPNDTVCGLKTNLGVMSANYKRYVTSKYHKWTLRQTSTMHGRFRSNIGTRRQRSIGSVGWEERVFWGMVSNDHCHGSVGLNQCILIYVTWQ